MRDGEMLELREGKGLVKVGEGGGRGQEMQKDG